MKRKRGIRPAGVLCVMVFCLGCENELYGRLSRTREDPFSDVPEAESFRTEDTVYLEWKGDEGADEYILMRKTDGSSGGFEEIYRGDGLSYTDTNVTVGTKQFIYRLDKRRGKAYFKGKGTALGVGSGIRGDGWEDNDTEGRATCLLSKRDANLYYYRFSDGRFLTDTDWYYYTVPARTVVQIKFSETGLVGLHCDFVALVPGGTEEPVTPNVPISLTNNGETPRDIKIRVTPNMAAGVFSTIVFGGTSVNYTIEFYRAEGA